jgi:hypothetical protein
MKKTALLLLSLTALAGSANAGPLVALPVNPTAITPSVLFRDSELFFDAYGSYLNHRATDCSCGGKSEGYGGGFAVGHYFGYYIGARLDVNFSSVEAAQTSIGGDILLRYPIPNTHLAPYAFVGGGIMGNDGNPGFFRAGGGLEWRFTSHFSIFGEGSYAWVYEDDNSNNTLVKVGVRLIY